MVAVAEGIVALSLALCVLIIPLWILTRLFGKGRAANDAPVQDEKGKVEHLLGLAEAMEKRLLTLEAILDKHNPNWRREI